MNILINPLTFTIFIPKTELTLIQSTPTEIRELNINEFRLALKDWEDDEGITMVKTHEHYPESSVGGVILARVVVLLEPYTITFEDGQYAVNLIGANSNLGDRVNVNQVSIRSANSAGMTSSPLIEYASFENRVCLDAVNGVSGTVFPRGTRLLPVNNLADAQIILNYRSFYTIELLSNFTIQTGKDISNLHFVSCDWQELLIETGVNTLNTEFERISLDGELSGIWNICRDCWLNEVTNFMGWMIGGSYTQIELAPYVPPNDFTDGSSFFDDLVPMYTNIASALIMNTDTKISFTKSTDIHEIRNMTVGSVLSTGLSHGKVIIDSSCTGGEIIVLGIGEVENNSTLSIDISNLVNAENTQYASFNGGITVDSINGVDATEYPAGTSHSPVKTCEKAIELAEAKGFKKIYITNDFLIASNDMSSYSLIGLGPKQTTVTLNNTLWTGGTIENCYIEGTFADDSFIRIEDAEIGNLSNITINARNCVLSGTIELNDTESSNFTNCTDGIPGSDTPIIQVNDCQALGIWGYNGGIKITNMITPGVSVSFNAPAGRLIVDSTDTQGIIIARGVGSVSGTTDGTTITQIDLINKNTIADTIWDEPISDHTSVGSIGHFIQKKLLTVAKFIGLK